MSHHDPKSSKNFVRELIPAIGYSIYIWKYIVIFNDITGFDAGSVMHDLSYAKSCVHYSIPVITISY